ncbi:hypothetical protein PLESTF_000775700 [Pleodorina starrii]|nr:hypothetical protein PLESTM_000571300 [Pleodorina starrii]GLC69065.1 hypothetical protein PLESTF_000775700 [Pleodorina starrii]
MRHMKALISICCDPRPLTPLPQSDGVVELLRLLGPRPEQAQLILRDAHCHPVLGVGGGGLAALARCSPGDGSGRRCPVGDAGAGRGRRDSDSGNSGGGSGDDDDGGKNPLSAVTAIAAAMAAVLPNLTHIQFTGSMTPTPSPTPTPTNRPGGSINNRAGRAGGGGGGAAAANGGRAVLAPQPLLQQLAAALLQPPGRDAGGAGICGGGSGGGGSALRPVGLQALCVDYSEPSVDTFEAELLDHHYPRLPLLMLDFRGAAAAAAAGCGAAAAAAAAAAQHPILRHHPALQRPSAAASAAAPPPLLRLTSLELRGVAVQPGLLSGLRQLAALTRLVLSVSCPRPYEPLVTSLPYMTRLAHLHLFLHVPSSAAARQLASSCRGRHLGGGGGGGGGGVAEDGSDDAPDCTAIQLAAAVSQCRQLVSLALPGEDVGGQMPALLQALPGLTHLAARQLCPWELAAPHTALCSLTLTMTWPTYLAPLLACLPRLDVLAADMYVHADGGGGGNGGGGGGDGDGAAAEQLYDEVLAATSALRGVRRVELQLSVMRCGGWEWGRLVRLLAAVRGLAGLTVRMPQRDSGPALRAQHFVGMCRQLTGLRRLTLLLAHPGAAKLNAKALQALQNLPYIRTVQLHLGGVWEGRRVPVHGDNGADDDGSGSGNGGAAASSSNNNNSYGSHGGDGGRNNRSRFRSGPRQAAAEGDAAGTSHSRPKGRSGRNNKPGAGCDESAGLSGLSGREGGDARGPQGAHWPGSGGANGHNDAAALTPPPLPGSAAARAVLEAARGLGCRGGRPGAQRAPRPGARRGPRARRGLERRAGGGGEGASGGASSAASSESSGFSSDSDFSREDADGGGELDCADAGRGGDGDGQPSSSGGGGGGGGGGGAAARPVQLQVDFLTAREAAEVNAVLRWEGRPAAVVRAGLQPRWVWAEFAAGGRGG